MRKLINRILFLLNIILSIALVLSYLSPYLSPGKFWYVSLLGTVYPFLLFLNGIFAIYWIIRFKRYVVVPLAAIGLGYFNFGKFVQFNDQKEYPPINSIKILSHNQRALGLNGPIFQTEDGQRVFEFLDEELYDVYCFQEFFDTKHKEFAPYDSIKRITGAKYRHVEYLVEFRESRFGIATLSRYPIVDKGVVQFQREGTNMCIYSDIDFDGVIVRIYNMHLQSLGFSQKDVKFMQSLGLDNEEALEGAKGILSTFRSAFIKREEQAQSIRDHIDECPYPVIICGDFNDTPLSYAYRHIKGDLTDAFVKRGKGVGSTYNGVFPMLRIDYILHSPELNNTYYKRIKRDLSDHYPLTAYFTFEGQKDD